MPAQSPNQHQVVPLFRVHTSYNDAKSKKAGRPIYDETEVCELRFPANRKTIGVYPAHEPFKYAENDYGFKEPVTYAMEYSAQYKQFKDGHAQTMTGTPIEELSFLTASKRLELKALNIYTAEQLAALDGQPLKQLGMSGRSLKDQASAYLEAAQGSADVTRLAAENAELREMMKRMQAQIANLASADPSPAEPVHSDDDGEDSPPISARLTVQAAVAASDVASEFSDWADADIKEWIRDETGATPRGNPSHATLVAMADQIKVQKGEGN